MKHLSGLLAEFNITDDSGFVGIVNADKYESFVDPDWEFSQLTDHFTDEMNNQNLVIWATGGENEWHVVFLTSPSEKKAFREFSQRIEVTDNRLYLTNFEDLTMAAQFKDKTIPLRHNSNLFITLQNGSYNFTIRQILDPDDYESFDSDDNYFEVIVAPTNNQDRISVSKIYWSD